MRLLVCQRPGPAPPCSIMVRALGTLTRYPSGHTEPPQRHFQSHIMLFRSEMFLQAALRARSPGSGDTKTEEPQTLPSRSSRSMEEEHRNPVVPTGREK